MDHKVFLLKRRRQYEQRTPEWYDARRSLITASSAASLLVRNEKTCKPYVTEYKEENTFDYNNKSCNPYTNKTQYLLDKCRQKAFKGNIATFWGQKYEPVVTDLYSLHSNKDVLEFGLLIHPEHPWLGASPDGITPDGVMIEIKCPFRRKITGIPPLYYWIQVQLQLEVCDLDVCDFVEYEFTEFETEEEYLDDETLNLKILNKGVLIQVSKVQENKDIPCHLEDMKYIYPPKELIDKPEILEWAKEVLASNKDNTLDYTPIYWKATENSILRIHRNKEWFANVKDTLAKEWKQMTYYQTDNNYKKLLNQVKTFTEGKVLVIDTNDCLFSDEEDTGC